MSFSKILSRFDKRDIGRLLVKSNLQSFLWIGITLALFKRAGKVSIVKERLNKLVSYSEISFSYIFKTLLRILYG